MSDAAQPSQPETGHGGAEEASSSQTAPEARAEELVNQIGERLGHFATLVSQRAQWAIARAREEAEDIWAEAQELRRNKGP